MTHTYIGKKGVLVGQGTENEGIIIPDTVDVGDKVIIYPIKDNTRVAIPSLTFNIGDHAFAAPTIAFPGFNWKLNFEFNLIPFIWQFVNIGDWFFVGPAFNQEGGFPQYWEKLIGSINIRWGGDTRVWISNYTDHIYAKADDGYRIYNRTNSNIKDLRRDGYGVYLNDPLPEITSVLDIGWNNLDVYVKDWWATAISCPDVYILITT